jgi:SAM-dependent methyltransferase
MAQPHSVPVDPSNAQQLAAWNGDQGAYWASHAEQFEVAVAGYDRHLFAVAAINPGERVLDIGCGSGRTTLAAARGAAPGLALGVDLSARMIDVARQAAQREGLPNARFVQADAQIHPFPEQTFDVAISRTGAMFFGDPVAAFTNIARAMCPGGRLILLVWQPFDRNEYIVAITTALAAGRDFPPPSPGSPGPFSMARPARVRAVLTEAGFSTPSFASCTEPMYFGRDPQHAFQFMIGLAGWMLDGLDDHRRARAFEALRTSIHNHHTARGVAYGSAAWLVTATRR